MERGIRQGCPVSCLLFLLVIEVLGTMIRKSVDIKGIIVSTNEHKLIQFADDATICVRDIDSIPHVLQIITTFGNCAGLELNLKKTKGIWLGNLKDLGFRKYCDITWTGKPIKCLGLYIGHKKDQCFKLNWENKLMKVEKCIANWKKWNLTLYGKVKVIKRYVLSKIVFLASVLPVPEEVTIRLFYYTKNRTWWSWGY